MDFQIDHVTTVLLKPNDMKAVNQLTDIDPYASDNWVDLSTFEDVETLQNYITYDIFTALEAGLLDYVVFRIDY